MTFISSINSSALQIMQQYQPPSASFDNNTPVGNDIVATANGIDDPLRDARTAVSESVFSVNHVDVTKMKLDLMEKVGDAFGIKMDDYDSQASYGFAIRRAVSEIRQQPDGSLVLAGIEKGLGLDKLGLSIDTMVNAIIDPQGKDGEKLDAALKRQAGEDGKTQDTASVLASIRLDDTGIYGPSA